MTAYEKLQELQITLPVAEAAVAAFVPTVRTGKLLFVSGHLAKRDGKPWAGKLGVHLTTEEGKLAARSAAIDLLATLHHELRGSGKGEGHRQDAWSGEFLANFAEQHLVANGRVRASPGSIWRQG